MDNVNLFLITFSIIALIGIIVVNNIDFSKFKKKDLYEK